MSDFKKSKKMDSKKSGETSDLENLIEDIDQAEQEADEQIQTLETRITEIKELEQKLDSVTEKLSEVEGDALQKAQQDINQNIRQKGSEAEECRNKLNEISAEMQEKQGEVQEEIGKREGAISELDTAERECDVDLSDAKNAVNEEKGTFEEANSKIEQLLGRINGSLADNQAEKKTEVLKNFLDSSRNWIGESLQEAVKTGKNVQTTLMMATSLYGGILTKGMENFVMPLTDDINSSIFAPLTVKDSHFSIIKDTLDKSKEYHGIDSNFSNLDSSREPDKKRRERESEVLGEVRNKPEFSSK
ncbi:hypothetical protein VB620_03450 [Nodularia harveyana UHCC-0300]|uniref:Uncharacterized protein n=1 Tax=Nodularia harveyana UHCC-0300 TaxID=2974287 RepID=A0ABU5UB96_9CYAN|nr:hypothetical protein [Nodularia harveyana]MEA5580395.1 hypothetical protein [Nodularia harveyana UHCC-0300]